MVCVTLLFIFHYFFFVCSRLRLDFLGCFCLCVRVLVSSLYLLLFLTGPLCAPLLLLAEKGTALEVPRVRKVVEHRHPHHAVRRRQRLNVACQSLRVAADVRNVRVPRHKLARHLVEARPGRVHYDGAKVEVELSRLRLRLRHARRLRLEEGIDARHLRRRRRRPLLVVLELHLPRRVPQHPRAEVLRRRSQHERVRRLVLQEVQVRRRHKLAVDLHAEHPAERLGHRHRVVPAPAVQLEQVRRPAFQLFLEAHGEPPQRVLRHAAVRVAEVAGNLPVVQGGSVGTGQRLRDVVASADQALHAFAGGDDGDAGAEVCAERLRALDEDVAEAAPLVDKRDQQVAAESREVLDARQPVAQGAVPRDVRDHPRHGVAHGRRRDGVLVDGVRLPPVPPGVPHGRTLAVGHLAVVVAGVLLALRPRREELRAQAEVLRRRGVHVQRDVAAAGGVVVGGGGRQVGGESLARRGHGGGEQLIVAVGLVVVPFGGVAAGLRGRHEHRARGGRRGGGVRHGWLLIY
eukprot:Rhum_TRINITY_DN23075_c0_g1::Rhum_TRINITY_DN23075_c0_g1_i1::g.177033::m.177033